MHDRGNVLRAGARDDGDWADLVLPSYVDDGPQEEERGSGYRHPVAVAAAWRATAQFLDRIEEQSRAAHGVTPSPSGAEVIETPTMAYVFTRHLLLAPDDAVAAFDAWRRGTSTVQAAAGRLRLTADLTVGESARYRSSMPRARGVAGRLRVAFSATSVPMELDLLVWNGWHVVLDLALARRRFRTIAPQRRRAFFAAGNAVTDAIAGRLRSYER